MKRILPLYDALSIANEVMQSLYLHCVKIDIAGSIRREKQDVGDIEIVCLPKTELRRAADLFGGETTEHRVPAFVHELMRMGTVLKGNPLGHYMQIELKDGVCLDVFMPNAWDYYRQLAIRTGSAEFSQHVIAKGWVMKGWRGTPDGLRLEKECMLKNEKWICTAEHPTLPPVWESENEFFDWIGQVWIAPQNRILNLQH